MDKYNPKSIKDAMRRNSIEVDDLVEKLEKYTPKVSRTLVFGWLGGSCPSAINVYALCKILDMDIDDFFIKASKDEEKEYIQKREERNKRRTSSMRKFDTEAASSINSLVEKMDEMKLVLKKGNAKKKRSKK